jgi:hypothetical protein
VICPNCHVDVREGELFCPNCSYILSDEADLIPTKKVDPHRSTWGISSLKDVTGITIRIRDAQKSIDVPLMSRIIIGRYDAANDVHPDIDLSDYGGEDKGVSRMHAGLERNGDALMVVDFSSANGTFLNGQKLVPGQPRLIRDGDALRFGHLVCYIYLKREK